ncbi:MAG: (2Fe-2S)-binding protein, partial [Gammaproteobacteria bacterium]|nr:(2Fe-2S)-binding protein [Gammaproteobacteria bacterium]
LDENPNPTESEIDTALSGNICRSGCYPRIKKAVLAASSAQPLFRNAARAQGA